METSMGGTGPYIIFRNYGSEGWSAWERYETVQEAVERILQGSFSEEIVLVRKVELTEKAQAGFNEQSAPREAIRNAGKPTLRKGQLTLNDGGHVWITRRDCGDVSEGHRPLKWSDLVGEDGISLVGYRYTEDGPVFLRKALPVGDD